MGNKRRRLALSCVDCRRRKVKCDRSYPTCVRCQKAGHAEKCVYVPYEGDREDEAPVSNGAESPSLVEDHASTLVEGAEEESRNDHSFGPTSIQNRVVAPHKKTENSSDTVRRLQKKLEELEERMKLTQSKSTPIQTEYRRGIPTPASTNEHEGGRPAIPDLEQALIRGKSFKTQYYGPSHHASILLQFDGLSTFIKDIMDHFPALDQIRRSMEDFKKYRNAETLGLAEASHDWSAFLELIPDQETSNVLVHQYMDNFETTYRVLHIPSFKRKYEDLWRAPQESGAEFLVVLLLIMATVYCISPQGPLSFVGRSSKRRETAAKWIAVCESWMQVQSHKHVTIVTYQVHILLFLAKRMNWIKVKRGWTSAGHLVRLAMAAGLHREPTLLSDRISVFDQEMRRRLWATIVELEMLSAIDKGMPSSLTPSDWDCNPPSNIHDEEIDETCEALPPARPLDQFTRTAFLRVASQSAPLRLEMLSTINRVRTNLSADVASQYDARIRQALVDIPSWSLQISSQLPRSLARMQLLEYIILVHQPFVTSKDPLDLQFFSRVASRDAASGILELYAELEDLQSCALLFNRSDSFRAGLSICYDMATSPNCDRDMMFDVSRATELVEQALRFQRVKVMQLGQGFHAYWITSSALSLAYSKMSPLEPSSKFARQAADRVIKINGEMITLQEQSAASEVRPNVGDRLLFEAQSGSAQNDLPQQPFAELSVVDPFNDPELGLQNFNIADVWGLGGFWDFSFD